MKENLSDPEIAQYICENNMENAAVLNYFYLQSEEGESSPTLWKEAPKDLNPKDILALLHKSKVHRPELHKEEAISIWQAINGTIHNPTVFLHLPEYLATIYYTWAIEEHEAEPLRREIEEGPVDKEFFDAISETPIMQFTNKLRKLEPIEVLSIMVSQLFFQARRFMIIERGADCSDLDLGFYFSIND